jgi:ATP-dependent RNA helicase RhlE
VFKYLERKSKGALRVIHANKAQQSRINAMNDFKEGSIRILVSTDVSARGIDVSMVSHVINFEVPLIYEDYVHRIGRTGRAKQSGVAITFVNPAEIYHMNKIEALIREQVPVRAIPAEVPILDTPYEEKQDILREIDNQKKRENPDFKGAFHEKKERPKSKKERSKRDPSKKASSKKDLSKKRKR